MSRGAERGVIRRGRRARSPRSLVGTFINASAIGSGGFVPHVNIAVARNNVAILAVEMDKIDRRDVAGKVHGVAPVDRDSSHHGICTVDE